MLNFICVPAWRPWRLALSGYLGTQVQLNVRLGLIKKTLKKLRFLTPFLIFIKYAKGGVLVYICVLTAAAGGFAPPFPHLALSAKVAPMPSAKR